MALILADRVRETTTTTGTGAVVLAGAYQSYRTFLSAIGDGNTTYYAIANANTGDWEVGIGTYSSGTNSLSRDTILSSSNSGAVVNLSAGVKDIFVTQPSERAVYVSGTSVVAANSATVPNSLLANSSLTINGNSVSLGGSTTVTSNTTNSLTFNNSGTGAASGTAFNGSTAYTISYNTVGASPTAGSSSITTLGTVTTGTWNATAITTTYGGTGLTTFTAGDLPYYATGTALSKLGIGAANTVLTSSGTAPQWSTSLTLASNLVVNGNTTLGDATSDTITLTGTVQTGVVIAAGTATANTAPIKFTSGTNLTTPEAGVIEYDGTIMSATSNTNFKRGAIPLSNYTSGSGTALTPTATGEATNQVVLPAANDTITLSVGTYYVDMSFIITRGATSTTSATARLNILGTGTAVGTFSGQSMSAPTAGGATANFSFDAVNINTSNVLTTASTTASGVYTMVVQGVMKITTAGTIIPQYSLSAALTGATTATTSKVFYLILRQMDTQSAAAAGPSGTGWG